MKKRIPETVRNIIEIGAAALTAGILLAGCNAAEQNADVVRMHTGAESNLNLETIWNAKAILDEKDHEIPPEDAYRQAYYDFLKEYAGNNNKVGDNPHIETEEARFALAYVDGDEIPELILIEDNSYRAGVDVYTYIDDTLIKLGSFGSYGEMWYAEKQGYVYSRILVGEDGFRRDYYAVEDGKALLEKSDELYRELEYIYINYIDGTAINNAELERLRTGELRGLLLTQEEIFKRKLLRGSGEEESAIVWTDYDDYDGNGKHEMFALCGKCSEAYGEKYYSGTLWFVDINDCMPLREESYRMMEGKMELAPDAKYLFFYTDYNFTANITEIWTVVNGKPEENRFSEMGQAVYRGGSDFEIWLDAYDHFYCLEDELWSGHTYKPYFYHYDEETEQLERYAGEIISKEAFVQLSGIDLIAEIEAKGYEIGDIIRWENDIITLNYVIPVQEKRGSIPEITYENIIWDNAAKDYWRAEERGVASWEDSGEGGSYHVSAGIGDGWELKKEMTDEELCKLARQYYEKHHDGYSPDVVIVDSWKYDKAVIHLYDDFEDHIATCDWYTVDRRTGVGENILFEEINLLE